MACLETVRLGDVGTIFRGTIYDENDQIQDISAATVKQLLFKKSDGTLMPKSGTFLTDGTDGVLMYTAISGDLNVKGKWKLELYVVTPTREHHSDIQEFLVENYLTSS